MRFVRGAWVVVAAITAAIGFLVVSEPMWQITSCELGIFPVDGVDTWEQCNGSILDHYGWSIVALFLVPVLLCLIPAAVPGMRVAWVVAGALSAVSIGLLILGAEFFFYGNFFPSALLAVILAVVQWRRSARGLLVHAG